MPVTLQLIAAEQATTVDEYLEVCPAERFEVHRRQPGFVLAEARNGLYLVGYAYGLPLRPSTDWWRHLTAPLPADVTTERAGRTFAVMALAVRPAWRRQGIGRDLHDLVLDGRPEERATTSAPQTATAAQAAYPAWGWRKVGRALGDAAEVRDVFIRDLGEATNRRVAR